MDFLKKEIERKRKELDEANLLNSNKKYFKRGELEQKFSGALHCPTFDPM